MSQTAALPDMRSVDIKREQQHDPIISEWFNYVRQKQKPKKEQLPLSPYIVLCSEVLISCVSEMAFCVEKSTVLILK